jgi:SAM-dependent methyltransferase
MSAEPRVPAGPTLAHVMIDLAMSSWALAALAWCDETGVLDRLVEPRSPTALASETGVPAPLVTGVLDVLGAVGLVTRQGEAYVAEPVLAAGLVPAARRQALSAELRSNVLQAGRFVDEARRGPVAPAWDHADELVLEAQGARSAPLVGLWIEHLFPTMDGLATRLEGPSAAFLDVGSGVGALTVGMCLRYPSLRGVGLDPFGPAVALARGHVSDAGLVERIELRDGRLEDLADEEAFDLIHIPSMFMPVTDLQKGLARARRALRPGGWVLLQVLGRPGDSLLPAVARLWCTLWGGEPFGPEEAVGMLASAGFAEARVVPPLPGPPVGHVVGRRL